MPDPRPPAKSDAPAPKPAVAREFQPAAIALEEEEPARVHWWTLYAATGLLATAVLWASLADIDRIVMARGELVTVEPALVVQPLERVGVRAVHVRTGDIVAKGQVLASLDQTFAQADVEQLQTKVASYRARQARLEAEIRNADFRPGDEPDRSARLELSLFNERRQTYAARLRTYHEELSRIGASLAATRADIDKASSRMALLQQIVDMRQAMVMREYDTQLRLLEAKAQLIATEREKIQGEGKIAELQHQLMSVNAQRDAYVQEWREKAADELVTVRREREAATEELNKALRRRDMVTLVAPEAGVVQEIGQRSIGSVLREAEILFTLVPLEAVLEAEVRVSPRDIGVVKVGDEVRIKLDAFPFQQHGTATGRVTTISADAFRPGRGEGQDPQRTEAVQFHKARVTLADTALRNVPPHFRLLPGMTVSAEIKVGTRRVISYLLNPILKGLDESLREP
ncbi:HlyD family type I secretion periplasmic adaptor subunit [Rhodoplanes sp. TEM]|uniref:Membrane fusion protein (MFP) family protein n=1 Tax=Rhodoplanes tepidamans TaxID=200616 RepID=A0ABT5J3Y3_RHOTP|nr:MULTISPECIES: HlyD family type I secretion periplasmic adaptor subunit [Rhodoplanes]MDC7784346.1 HlyD family type I secretion periplasmic adaptor subunit [Rhodoplanes tepidamans]MDC7983390.1 HlyD family type I secretion periplasmic adaptor subunit [Rhodoplanes sp. TEM]MDQ0354526.1 HlyD family secretion protein [Rhodoplanes tepidamans]